MVVWYLNWHLKRFEEGNRKKPTGPFLMQRFGIQSTLVIRCLSIRGFYYSRDEKGKKHNFIHLSVSTGGSGIRRSEIHLNGTSEFQGKPILTTTEQTSHSLKDICICLPLSRVIFSKVQLYQYYYVQA